MTPVYHADGVRTGVAHTAGHGRLGPSFTACGKLLGDQLTYEPSLWKLCKACRNAPKNPAPPPEVVERRGRVYPGIQERLVALREDLRAEAKTGDDLAAAAADRVDRALAALRGEL